MPIKRRALLIGIQYAGTNHCLEDAHHYVRKMRDHLLQKLHWPAVNIRCLVDQREMETEHQPTKKNILREISKRAQKTAPGDVLFIYYCGHGTTLTTGKNSVEVLIPRDHLENGYISAVDVNRIFRDKLKERAKCFLVIDACHYGFRAGLGRKVIPRSLPPKQNLLLVDNNGQANLPVGALEILNEHDAILNSKVILLTCQPSGEDIVIYGLLTDYFIRQISRTTNLTFAALMAKLGRDFLKLNINISNQIPILAYSAMENDIINERIHNYI